MAGIKVKVEDSFDKALRQFKRKCIDAGLLLELKRRAYYEKPSEQRRKQEKQRKIAIKRSRYPKRYSSTPPSRQSNFSSRPSF